MFLGAMPRRDHPVRLMQPRRKTFYVAAAVAAATAALTIGLIGPAMSGREPTRTERRALEWTLAGTRKADAFPDQGMPEDARPVYVVFDRSEPELFHVVFEESDSLYTGRYRSLPQDNPKLVTVRSGYGWADLSRPQQHLSIWKLEDGRWEVQPADRGVDPLVGPRFEVTTYNLEPPADRIGPRHMHVNGSGSNIGDARGRAECFLVYGSQTTLIEGDYLHEALEPGETLVVSGDVMFPRPLDDNESGGLECEPQRGD